MRLERADRSQAPTLLEYEFVMILFQIADDLIDYSGSTKKAGKKTGKDSKKGKATLISLLGYKNTVKYGDKVKLDILNKIKKFGNKTKDLTDTINYILIRSK